jgi:hypothetical protein
MNLETHSQLASFIWGICNLLRGPYKSSEYRKVILPLTVLRRFVCLLAPTKERVLREHTVIKAKPESVVRSRLGDWLGPTPVALAYGPCQCSMATFPIMNVDTAGYECITIPGWLNGKEDR